MNSIFLFSANIRKNIHILHYICSNKEIFIHFNIHTMMHIYTLDRNVKKADKKV
nr:MAG TPA: hypothetical protein [Caudoviricetes sp.]